MAAVTAACGCCRCRRHNITMTDLEVFEMMAGHIKTIATELLETFFGERCKEFEMGCEVCSRWTALDILTENPFKIDYCEKCTEPSLAMIGRKRLCLKHLIEWLQDQPDYERLLREVSMR